jgi:hypothetical protein
LPYASIGIEVVGTGQEVADFCEFIRPYGLLETLSVASVPNRGATWQQYETSIHTDQADN